MKFFAKETKLVTIPSVELMEVGMNWPLSSGDQTFTEDDLLAVVASQDDPAVHAPRLKVGHADGRLDGEPAFGKFVNLRVINDGQTLVGDLTGVPEWLAKIMPTAYPNRSVEGGMGVTTATGKKWPLVLTAVALLGVEMPGISTLEDLESYYADEMPEGVVLAKFIGNEIQASVDVEDVRRSFYETVAAPGSDRYWWWVRSIQIDPQQAIVEDEDAGKLYRIPYSTAGDTVTWQEAVAVEIHYVDIPEGVAASADTFYASAAESRPAERSSVDPKQLRTTLGLAEDASDAEVTAKLTLLKAAAESTEGGEEGGGEDEGGEGTPAPAPAPAPDEEGAPARAAAIPEGMVLVDKEALESIQAGASRATELWREREQNERDTAITAAVKAGKFPRARVEHYATMWDADKEGTKALLASMAEGLIPVTEIGAMEGPEGEAGNQEAYPLDWLTPAERRNVEAHAAGNTPVAPGTITSERVGT